jgi:DNA replication and repair protein RecF
MYFWNRELIHLGSFISIERKQLADFYNKYMSEKYYDVSHEEGRYYLEYKSNMIDYNEDELFLELQKRSERDKALDSTSLGPHRDNILFYLNNKHMQEFCSRGEIRSAVLSLKLTEMLFMESTKEEKPVLLLDDVFSELDGKRRRLLFNLIQKNQSLITTTELDKVIHDDVNIIDLEKTTKQPTD